MHNMTFPKDNEIVLVLDGYTDLFSDFDPRSFDKRALSHDFLEELKRASMYKDTNSIFLNLLVSKSKRDMYDEKTISRRLKEHFSKHFSIMQWERSKIIRRGFYFFIAGIIFMVVATILLFSDSEKSFLKSLIIVFLEPGGWFSFWEGLNQMIFESKTKQHEFNFYKLMSNCSINFSDA